MGAVKRLTDANLKHNLKTSAQQPGTQHLPAWPLPLRQQPKSNLQGKQHAKPSVQTHLYIWWPFIAAGAPKTPIPDPTAHYTLLDDSGLALETSCAPMSQMPKAYACTVLLHPFNISLCPFTPPNIPQHKLQQSAGLLTEHLMLSPPEDNWVHIIKPDFTKRTPSSQTTACITSKQVAEQVFQTCTQHQLALKSISSELLFPALSQPLVWEANHMLYCITSHTPAWCAPIANTHLCVGLLKQTGHAFNTHSNANARSAQHTNRQHPSEILVHTGSPNINPESLHEWIASAWSEFWPDAQLLPAPSLTAQHIQEWQQTTAIPDSVWHEQCSLKPTLGILRPYSGKKLSNHSAIPWWQNPVVAAMVLLFSILVALNWRAGQIQYRQNHLENQIRDTFAAALPNTPMNADPELLLQREIKMHAESNTGSTPNQTPISNALNILGSQMSHFNPGSIESIQYDKKVNHGAFNIVMNGQMRLSDLQNLISEQTQQTGGDALKKSIQLHMDQKTKTGSYVLSFKVPHHE